MQIYLAIVACFSGLALAVDTDFCSSQICTMDYIPHCMTDGTIVRGCTELKTAICTEKKTEVVDWDSTKNCLPKDYCKQEMCTMDLLPHCMRTGDIVRGCSELKDAICSYNQIENRSWTSGERCFPFEFCEWKGCTKDLMEHCLTDGTKVHGCEQLKTAICTENKWVNIEYEGGECEATE